MPLTLLHTYICHKIHSLYSETLLLPWTPTSLSFTKEAKQNMQLGSVSLLWISVIAQNSLNFHQFPDGLLGYWFWQTMIFVPVNSTAGTQSGLVVFFFPRFLLPQQRLSRSPVTYRGRDGKNRDRCILHLPNALLLQPKSCKTYHHRFGLGWRIWEFQRMDIFFVRTLRFAENFS